MTKESYTLITSVKAEISLVDRLFENCEATGHSTLLICEAADKYIGNAIAALKAGKDPFETMPGSKDMLAGLMLLAGDDYSFHNAEALNLNKKQVGLIASRLGDEAAVNRYVGSVAEKRGPSLLKNLDAYVNQKDKREDLILKLVKLQQVYSQVKQRMLRTQAPAV